MIEKTQLRVMNPESEEGSSALVEKKGGLKLGKTAPIRALDKSYGAPSNSLTGSKGLLFEKLDNMTARAEGTVESMLFTYEEEDKSQ